jgi:hypothetical protein
MHKDKFNENDFISFLNNVNASDVFSVCDSLVVENNHPILLVKEYDPTETFAAVYDTSAEERLEVQNVRLGKGWTYCGIYFRDLNTFVYNEQHLKLLTDLCMELKTVSEDKLYNGLFVRINLELESRQGQFAEAYKEDKLFIKDIISANKEKMFTELVTGVTEDTFKIQRNSFNIYRSFQLTHKYLKDRNQCVTDFIDRYIEENDEEIKYKSLYPDARDEYERVMEGDEYFKKAKRAYSLLNGKFQSAVTVWVVTTAGEKKKVFNQISIDGKEIIIGVNANTVRLEDVVQIQYREYRYKLN